MAGSDVDRTITWIISRLRADATLTSLGLQGVYDGDAPVSAAYPFALVTNQGTADTRGVGGLRIAQGGLVRVAVIKEGWGADSIRPIAERIDALLDGVSASSSELTVIALNRESEDKRAYTEDGIHFEELLADYRKFVRSS